MLALLQLIPIVGTIASGISSYLQTRNELKQAKDNNDLEEIRVRAETRRTDIRLQFQQDMIIFPVALWCMLYTWKQITIQQYPDLVWQVAELDNKLFLPVLAYLFALPIRNYYTK